MIMKGKTKTQKGITLVALIITIVVLLILAAVAISSIQGDGILRYATNASNSWNQATINEQGTIGGYENYLKNLVGGEVEEDEVTMLSGDGQTYYTLAPTALTFRSSADINDFQEVQINGVTLDQSNYTITEGSTIINLSIDYLKTLAEDNYSISIVSKTGSPSAGFSVVAPDLNEYGFYYNQPYVAYVDYFGANTAFFIREDGTLDVIVNEFETETCTYVVNGNNMTVTSVSMGELHVTFFDDGTEAYNEELNTTFKLGEEALAADEDYIYIYDRNLGGYVVHCIDRTQASYEPIKTGINGFPTIKLVEEMFIGLRNGVYVENTTLTKAPVIPDTVTAIGAAAFSECVNLTSVVIPCSVNSIGMEAFCDCTSLESIAFEGTVEQWNSIQKFGAWNHNVPATEVVCTDGTVTL